MGLHDTVFLRHLLEETHVSYHDAAHLTTSTSDGRSKIGEGVHFSRQFIISYNYVLLCILFCLTLWHWSSRLLRARRRVLYETVAEDDTRRPGRVLSVAIARTGDASPTSSSSSGSSSTATLDLSNEMAKEQTEPDETTSLIGVPRSKSSPSPIRILRSWLMYQPRNMPLINKTLPSNATSLVVLAFLGLNVFYLLYRVPLSLNYIFVLADRAGLLFIANLPLLYILAAKNQPIKWLTSHSYETLNIIHRRLGEWMCFIALVHFLGMVGTWYILLSSRLSFWNFLAIKLIWLGLAAFVSYETLYLTSLGSFRQRSYELFLGLHVLLQASALGFLFFHHPASRPYVGVALGIFGLDRLVFRLVLRTCTIKADLSILEDGETVLLSSNWDIHQYSWWRRINISHFLTVPALSKKHIVQAHPFTIASAAPTIPVRKNDATHAWLNLIIRARDGFSRDLLVHAQSHRSISIRVDGPYGSLHALEMLRDSDNAVVVAGGSGIAVAYPILFDLLSSAARCEGEEARAPSARRRRHVTLIWIIHDAQHVEWIGRNRLDELRERGLDLVIPPPTRKAGRPNIDRLLTEALAKDDRRVDSPSSAGVVITGPDSMNRSARNMCSRLLREGFEVRVSVEKFGW